MRRDHFSQPFDVEADEAADVTQQFWGSSRGWVSREHPTVDDGRHGDDATGALRVLRDGMRAFRPKRVERGRATGEIERTRQHGIVGRHPVPEPQVIVAREASLGELASGWPDDDADLDDTSGDHELATELIPLSPVQPLAERIGLGAIDPLLARVTVMVLALVVLTPLALALRPSTDGSIGTVTSAAGAVVAIEDGSAAGVATGADRETPVLPADGSGAQPATTPVDGESSDGAVARPADATTDATQSPAVAESTESAGTTESNRSSTATGAPATGIEADEVGDVRQRAGSSSVDAATVSATAERVVPDCPATYVANAGDSWYRIADAAEVSPTALLAENLATEQTLILPGDDICLPAGATMPAPPPTTTEPPATTVSPSTVPATTAPATTQPPATSAPASAAEVQQLIRDIWPDELEDKALQIAWRESNYRPDVYNGICCYGVFQIYWSVHVSWLDQYGISSSSDLLDARKNITAAYALYQRAGGWGPWGG